MLGLPASWDPTALAVAITLFVAPIIYFQGRKWIRHFRRKRRSFRRLNWDDIPDGLLYSHPAVPQLYQAGLHVPQRHTRGASCWTSSSSLADVFNRAWDTAVRNKCLVEDRDMPESLPLGPEFCCSDARTVLAFVLATATNRKSSSWKSKTLSYDSTRIIIEQMGDLTIAHIQGLRQIRRDGLTKNELGRMLSGWPPWYRERFVTRNGIQVPFPMTTDEDVPRGGWIAAVGFMDENIESQAPLALYCCTNEPEEPGWRSNGVVFRRAIVRCKDHIEKHIKPQFPHNQYVLEALDALEWLIEEKTESTMPTGSLEHAPQLSYSNTQFVCDSFNRFKALTSAEKTRMEPILKQTLSAVVEGASQVVHYLKDVGVELRTPPSLEPLDREVWLRDCVTRLPIR